MSEYGPAVDLPFGEGKPEWLDDAEVVDVMWNGGPAWYDSHGFGGAPAHCVSNWESVTKFRMRPDHPYYQTIDTAEPVEGQAQADPAYVNPVTAGPYVPTDYDMRSQAVMLANGNLTVAREIYTFLKGE